MDVLKSESVASQQQLFPQTIELNPADSELLKSILEDLLSLGFDIREFGKDTFIINGTPGVLDVSSPELIVEKLLEEFKNSPVDARSKAKEQIAIDTSWAELQSHPDKETALKHVFSEDTIKSETKLTKISDSVVIVDAINHALHEEMEKKLFEKKPILSLFWYRIDAPNDASN